VAGQLLVKLQNQLKRECQPSGPCHHVCHCVMNDNQARDRINQLLINAYSALLSPDYQKMLFLKYRPLMKKAKSLEKCNIMISGQIHSNHNFYGCKHFWWQLIQQQLTQATVFHTHTVTYFS